MSTTKTYRGYKIRYTDAGLKVTPPGALTWPEPAVNYETAQRWIDAHASERRQRAEHFKYLERRQG